MNNYILIGSIIILSSIMYIMCIKYIKNKKKKTRTEELKQKELENITLNKEDIQDNRTEEVMVVQEKKANSKESIVIVSSLALGLGLLALIKSNIINILFKNINT